MTVSKHLYTPDSTAISVFSQIYLYYSNYYGNQLESLSSSGNQQLAVHQLKVFLFLLLLYVYFLLCLNNVQYVIYGNSANKQRIELNLFLARCVVWHIATDLTFNVTSPLDLSFSGKFDGAILV